MRKLLIADGIEESRSALEAIFCDRCEVKTCADGETALELLHEFEPDILVLDLMLPKTDGLALIQKVRQGERQPMILAQTGLNSPYVMERLQRLEVDYVMLKPCLLQALQVRISDFLMQLQDTMPKRPTGNQTVNQMLMRLGFSPKLDGYGYLAEAIPLYAQDPSQSITKELYATVGEARRKEMGLVERSIRSAIDKAWRERDEKVWRQYFRCAPDGTVLRPSNGAFIARMAQLLAVETHGCIAL